MGKRQAGQIMNLIPIRLKPQIAAFFPKGVRHWQPFSAAAEHSGAIPLQRRYKKPVTMGLLSRNRLSLKPLTAYLIQPEYSQLYRHFRFA